MITITLTTPEFAAIMVCVGMAVVALFVALVKFLGEL